MCDFAPNTDCGYNNAFNTMGVGDPVPPQMNGNPLGSGDMWCGVGHMGYHAVRTNHSTKKQKKAKQNTMSDFSTPRPLYVPLTNKK